MAAQTKKYFVKHNYRFNLDSMRIHVMNMIDDIRDGEYETVELMGEKMDEDRLEEERLTALADLDWETLRWADLLGDSLIFLSFDLETERLFFSLSTDFERLLERLILE